jgi:membrane protease YdiL (CAAX protease family)
VKYLLNTLKEHFRNGFDWLSVVLVFLFTSVFVVMQYKFELIGSQIKSFPHLERIPLYLLLYAVIFLVSCVVLYWRKQIPNIFANKQFWAATCIILFILSFDQSYYLLTLIKNHQFNDEALKEAVVSLATYLVSFVSVIVPAFVLYKYYKLPSFYGLSFDKTAKVKPYFAVLFVALILVAVSTYSSGISSYYPVFKRAGIYENANSLGLHRWLAISIFETVYASNFISVELLFRGLFVFTFAKYLGKYAILPMAACYMVFHFGKPVVETISSFLGGYLLGVFALNTKNIWGGIILHIGTALFMELMASIL